MSYTRTAQNKISVTCNCVPNCFYLILGARLAGKGVENHEKRLLVFLAAWILFPKILGRLGSDLYYNCMKW